jgi:dihydrofolate reductase
VTDGIKSAIELVKAAAGDKDVNIIGAANTARQVLQAGLADKLHVDIMPVLLCSGLRLFEDISVNQI